MNEDSAGTGAAPGPPPAGAATTGLDESVSEGAPAAEPNPAERTRTWPDGDDVSQDDRDIGWGESLRPSGRDDDWYRRERPPHHD